MSKLYIRTKNFNGRTILNDSFFTSPIKIAKPFYQSNYTEIMMMSASAGILEGDFYDINIYLEENSNLKFTGQSYTKIFKATNKGASQRVKIILEDNAKLIYCPPPIIPFTDSIFCNNTDVYLHKNSKFVLCDILSCGRVTMNEKFKFKSYRSKISIYIDNKLKLLDNQRLVPSEINLENIGFFEGFTHIGLIDIYGMDIDNISSNDRVSIAVTKSLDGVFIRMFSNSSDDIIKYINDIIY